VPQQYTLRLADGTVLVVDHDSLSTWAIDGKAMIQPQGSKQWFALAEFLAAERIAARRVARQQAPAASRAALPLVPPPPRKPEPPEGGPPPGGADPSPPLSSPPPTETPPAPVLQPADDPPVPAVGGPAPSPIARVVVGRPVVRSTEPGPRVPRPDDSSPPIPLVPLDDEPAARPNLRPRVHALADDPGATSTERPASSGLPGQDLSTIPLKPLDDAAPGHVYESEREAASDGVELEAFFRTLGAALLQAAGALGTVLSRGSDRLVQLGRRLSASAPVTRLLERRAEPSGDAPVQTRSVRRSAPEPSTPPRVEPPPSLEALPLLRFAKTSEVEAAEDVYEGDENGPSLFAAVWRWTRRVLLAGAFVVGGVYAALTFESWFPKAGELGSQVMTGIDRHARRLATEEERLTREASGHLPHLAPDTVRLLLTRSPAEARDAAALYHRACDASDRGLGALTASETGELAALRADLVAELRPRERERLREHDRLRAFGATLSSEDRVALELVAGAARRLASPKRERLQVLLGKAIAAGLSPAPLADDPQPVVRPVPRDGN